MRTIYFDNAATTFKKPKDVIRKTLHFIQSGYANAGRSGHRLSIECAREIFEAREIVCDFLSYSHPENVVFTPNATFALNQAIKGLIPEGAHVLCSTMEHNSVLRPLYSLEKEGKIKLSFFSHRDNVEENIRKTMTKDTKALVCSLTSNVSGEEITIGLLSRLHEELGLMVIADASQLLGHKKVDLSRTPIDCICSAGHKGLFGMQGSGFALYNTVAPKTIVEGGSGFDTFSHEMPLSLPERLEAGTVSAPAIVSLKHGISYIQRVGIDKIEEKMKRLDAKVREILESIRGVHTLSSGGCGIHSFIYNQENSEKTASFLEKQGILSRGGFHCAPLFHEKFGNTETGAVRISLSALNSTDELDRFYKAMKKLSSGAVI